MQFAVLGNIVPIAIATAINFDSHRTVFFVGAVAACIAPLIVTAVPRRHRVVFYAAAFGGLPALTMMLAYSGGAASGYSVLLMMAVIWFGLQASDREMIAGVAVLAACAYLPMLVIGPPAYPVEWGFATLLVMIGAAVAGSLRAMTRETQRLTTRLRQEAVIDELTGLLNRRGWSDAAPRELARSLRVGTPLSLATIDLDDLKEINDSMGHDAGDRVLRETAQRLRAVVRGSDVVARWGGDEFVLLLTDARLDGAWTVVQRLRQSTPELGQFSAGIAAWDRRESLEELLHRCDIALYAAKADASRKIEIARQAHDGGGAAEPLLARGADSV